MDNYNEAVKTLKEADDAYYNSGNEIMSNKDYDELRDAVVQYETEHGLTSYTNSVGAKVESLKKSEHEFPALSLDKTKDIDLYIRKFNEGIADAWSKGRNYSKTVCLMWKMDGSTVVATYEGGKLIKLVTRGNGYVGSDITHNAPFIKGLPQSIPYKGKIIIRGEAVMSYKEFERINKTLTEEERYKNPRNLCNATIQLLDSNELSKRQINFKCFDWVYSSESLPNIFSTRLDVLKHLGIDCVSFNVVDESNFKDTMIDMENFVSEYEYPVDGLVACMEDVLYADALPGTGHNPHIMRGFAFKWADETAETMLRKIEWSPSRTGLLNPVAVFDPVELEGTTVTRASLHNLSYIADKDLQEGDNITVYKANKIIPQVADNLTAKMRSVGTVKNMNSYINITECPVCKGSLGINESNDTFTVICTNSNCIAKQIGNFVHFAERDCMDIRGLSEETLSKFVELGYISCFGDIYRLDTFENDIVNLEGFGRKSYDNLWAAIQESRKTDFISFLHACGIPNVGKGQAKLLKKLCESKIDEYLEETNNDGSYDLLGCLSWLVWNAYDFTEVEGFGDVIANSITEWVNDRLLDPGCRYGVDSDITDVLTYLSFTDERPVKNSGVSLDGKIFVITGSLNHFDNREALIAKIESLGGKASGSVSAKTSYLINNDVESTSGKNKKAKELGVPIISEDQFITMIS